MSIERKPLSSLLEECGLAIRFAKFGRTETEDAAARLNMLVIYRPENGMNSYVATVCVDDIFDPDGNRFYDDGEG